MSRLKVIQSILEKKTRPRYLEIGIDTGQTFLKLRGAVKVAVDPQDKLGKRAKLKSVLKNISNLRNKFHHVPSDDFFSKLSSREKFDVVFIDGLHTYGQSLKDVNNSLKHLKDDGIIIMHDCSPESEIAATPADSYAKLLENPPSDWNRKWNGDVWKTIVDLRSNRADLDVYVLNCDEGLGIVKKGSKTKLFDYQGQIETLGYSFLNDRRDEVLNLKEPEFLSEILQNL